MNLMMRYSYSVLNLGYVYILLILLKVPYGPSIDQSKSAKNSVTVLPVVWYP
eukprot:SAG31_NODE_627_length_13445_cov_18.311053_7_plen_52_part_00